MDRRRQATLCGTPAWVTTAEDVIPHKFHWHKHSPSDRQLHDASVGYAVQGHSLDMDYPHHWAPILDVERELDALLD